MPRASLQNQIRIFSAAIALACLILSAPHDGLSAETTKRQKVIDFEDEVVEGVNKRPWDSLSQISDSEKRRRKSHLYRKRGGFRTETQETFVALRFTPESH